MPATTGSSTSLGWRLAQPRPGLFEWTSPLRQIYRTRGEPIMPPLPDPQPRPPEPDNDHGRIWIEGPILRLPGPVDSGRCPATARIDGPG